MQVRIVGCGDAQCRQLEKLTRDVAAELNVRAQVELADSSGQPEVAVPATPALLIDGRLVAAGRMPTRNEIGSWLQPRWA